MSALSDPPNRHAAVTASDSTDLNGCRAVYVGGAGNVALRLTGNTTAVTYVGVTAGSYLVGLIDRVMATNTTATNIVAVY